MHFTFVRATLDTEADTIAAATGTYGFGSFWRGFRIEYRDSSVCIDKRVAALNTMARGHIRVCALQHAGLVLPAGSGEDSLHP